MTTKFAAKAIVFSAVLLILGLSKVNGSIICIQYSQQGDDLVFDYSGSLNINSLFNISGRTVAIGNQSTSLDKPAFYALPSGHSRLGTITNVSASANNFWNKDFSITSSNISLGANSDFFGFKYEANTNRVLLFGARNYQAGTSISGQLIAEGYTLAETGIKDWSVDLGDVGKIEIKAKSSGSGSGGGGDVPEPASIAIWSLIGFCAAGNACRRNRIKPVLKG